MNLRYGKIRCGSTSAGPTCAIYIIGWKKQIGPPRGIRTDHLQSARGNVHSSSCSPVTNSDPMKLIMHLYIYGLTVLLLVVAASATSEHLPGAFHKHHASRLEPHKRHSHTFCIEGDCAEGQGRISTPYHGAFHGTYYRGKIWSGRGVQNITDTEHYRGAFAKGKPHGIGVLHKFSGSTKYYGRFVQNTLIGPVTTVLRNGSRWHSRWKNGVPISGRTRWEWPASSEHGIYMGAWKNGKPAGYGVWLNGTDRYEGTFQDGEFSGSGMLMTSRNGGVRYDGKFLDGVFHGWGTLLEPNHHRYDGTFKHGKRHGVGYTRKPGFLWGTYIVKDVWRKGKIIRNDLPHSEL